MQKFNIMLTCAVLLLPAAALAKPKENQTICEYPTRYGEIRTASSLDEVPREARSIARCHPANQNTNLARPEDIKLDGNQREERIVSSVGEIQLRWPRKVESLFGRTPLRAMTDAANTVSRAVKNSALPNSVQSLRLEWKVVFMDESMPQSQIPTDLVTNCHPGWMTPPANIYIVAQRVAGGCGGAKSTTSVADSTLAQVLVHEMGHAVEAYMLEGKGSFDRVRAEGFATWWERYASNYSSILNSHDISRLQFAAAKSAIKKSPSSFRFGGSFEDYARASMYFSAITQPRGIQGLVDVYGAIKSKGLDLLPAIYSEMNWDDRRLQAEITTLLDK